MDDPVGYLYRTAMNLFRKRYRRTMLSSVLAAQTGSLASQDDFAEADERETVRARALDAPPAASTRCPRAHRDARVQRKRGWACARGVGLHRPSAPLGNRAASRSAKRWGLTMPSVRELLERERHTVELEGDHFGRLIRRRDRKQRNRRIGAFLVVAMSPSRRSS